MTPDVLVAAPEELAAEFAARFAALAETAIAARGRFSCALPGGSVAEAFFPLLASLSVDWDRVEFFWGDERAVGPADADSNYGLSKRLLLDAIAANPNRIHRMRGETPDLELAAQAYEKEMTAALGEPPRLDLVVLGVGPEGHVCSLFPGHPLLREHSRRVAAIIDSPKPPPRRITFTLAALALADTVCVAAFGEEKAEAMREAIEIPDSPLPVALAMRAAARVFVLLDVAAAGKLRKDGA